MEEPTPPDSPFEKLTVAGRSLLVLTVILFGGFGLWAGLKIMEDLPPGSYPLLILVVPVAGTGVLTFVGVGRLLERWGVRIFVKQDTSE